MNAKSAAANAARASPIPLLLIVLGFVIKYALEEIARAARIRGYHDVYYLAIRIFRRRIDSQPHGESFVLI